MDRGGRAIVLFLFIFASASAEQCEVAPKCSCTFGDEDVAIEEKTAGSEALAGTVGALGSLLVTGGGYGIWYLVKGRGGGGGATGNFGSTASLGSEPAPAKREPPEYMRGDGERKTNSRNIYSAGIGDQTNFHVPSRGRGGAVGAVGAVGATGGGLAF